MKNNQRNTASIFDRLNNDLDSESLSNKSLKDFVIRDLLQLLNTTGYHYDADVIDNEYSRSVINFGIEPISGRRVSEINWTQVEENIRLAIRLFEPRIKFDSLEVECNVDGDITTQYNQMTIEIKGLIRSTPYPEKFVLKTSLDVETGSFNPQN